MNVLSLFDGISCGRIALERARIKVDKYYASEIKEDAIKCTMENYPDTIEIGDVRKVDLDKLLGSLQEDRSTNRRITLPGFINSKCNK